MLYDLSDIKRAWIDGYIKGVQTHAVGTPESLKAAAEQAWEEMYANLHEGR